MRAELPELDALRGAAIIAVAGLHVSFGYLVQAPLACTAGTVALVVNLLCSFGAPMFVTLSMSGLALGYPERCGLGPDYREFLCRRIRRVLPAYLAWSAVTLLRNDPRVFLDPLRLASVLASGAADRHLYFVPLILSFYVWWPLLSRLAIAARVNCSRAAVIALAGLATSAVWWQLASRSSVSTGLLTLPLFWLGYAILGLASAPWLLGWLHHAKGRAGGQRVALLVWMAAGAWMVGGVRAMLPPPVSREVLIISLTIFQIPMLLYVLTAIALSVVLVARSTVLLRWLRPIGQYSYGVYLAHILVLEVVVQRLLGKPIAADFGRPTWLVTMMLSWLACVGLSYALIRALAAMGPLRMLAGARRPADARS